VRVLAAFVCCSGSFALVWIGNPGRPHRSAAFAGSALEVVADLDFRPATSVSMGGACSRRYTRRQAARSVRLTDGRPVPFPSEEWQHPSAELPFFQTVLSLRIDRQNRLWTLDFADFGRGRPRLLAFNLDTEQLVHEYEFPTDIAGFGSMLNDFQVSPDGETIYIAETSPIFQRPAIIVYDTTTFSSRRVLDRHPSVMAKPYIIQAPGRAMRMYGLIALRIAVDSIALDRDGEYLYSQ
jgi:hypothetical protein